MIRVTELVRLAVVLPAMASAGLTGGCEGSARRNDQTVRLIATNRPYEQDVPLPAGFTIVEQAMEDHSTGQARTYLRHLYAGRADKFAVRNFYREQMPLQRWAKVSDGAIKGEFTMRFSKGNEVCEINIRDDGKALLKKTLVQVIVAQEQRGTTPPLAQNHP
ncbi:MAG: hypothetical protein V2A79_06820 [Planctomycetota bacterium]